MILIVVKLHSDHLYLFVIPLQFIYLLLGSLAAPCFNISLANPGV